MKSALDIDGFWYLPSTPTNTVPGNLSTGSRGQLLLDLFGWPYDDSSPISRYPDVILGYTKHRVPVTLVDCFLQKGPTRAADIDHVLGSCFGAVKAIVGRHYDSRDKIKTNAMSVTFTKPYLWRLGYPIRQSPKREFVNPSHKKLSAELHINKPISLCRTVGLSISYSERVGSLTSGEAQGLEIQPHFRISTPRQRHLDEFVPIVRALQCFLSLGCGVSVTATDWRFVSKPRSHAFRWVNLYSQITDAVIPQPNEHELLVARADQLFDIRVLKGFSKKILNTWMENLNDFLPIYILFLEGTRDTDLSLDSKVLALAQAAEGFDRAVTGKNVPFRARITNLINNCPNNVIDYIGNISAFSKNVTNIRNYYSHYFIDNSAFPFSSTELHNVHVKLRLVLEVNLLRWAGLSEKELRHLIRQVWKYNSIR